MKQALIYSFNVWLTIAISIPMLAHLLCMDKKRCLLTIHEFNLTAHKCDDAWLNGLLIAVAFYPVFLICVILVTNKYKSTAVCKGVLTGIMLTLVAASFVFIYMEYSAYLKPWEFWLFLSLNVLGVPFAIYRYRLQPLVVQREVY